MKERNKEREASRGRTAHGCKTAHGSTQQTLSSHASKTGRSPKSSRPPTGMVLDLSSGYLAQPVTPRRAEDLLSKGLGSDRGGSEVSSRQVWPSSSSSSVHCKSISKQTDAQRDDVTEKPNPRGKNPVLSCHLSSLPHTLSLPWLECSSIAPCIPPVATSPTLPAPPSLLLPSACLTSCGKKKKKKSWETVAGNGCCAWPHT